MRKKTPDQTAKDAAGVGPHARERQGLVPLSEMRGWDVVKGGADIRSWEVRTLAGRILGHVRELLVDRKAGEVVMIDVDLVGSDKQALVPLRLVEVDRTKRVVRADSGDLEPYTDTDAIRGAPQLSQEELSRVRPPREGTRRASPSEKVVERKPIVEETVVRRRVLDDPETRL